MPRARPGATRDVTVDLTHIDGRGHARMVDVTAKPSTRRVAVARCVVSTTADVVTIMRAVDPLSVVEAARIAGIQAAKRTASLIPLCHAIGLDHVQVEVQPGEHRIDVGAVAEVVERTGVEMEALTACTVAALTLLAALLDSDPDASMGALTLWHKSGGRSGTWERQGSADG
jgi:cyclic pyranopterin phosphate synthase